MAEKFQHSSPDKGERDGKLPAQPRENRDMISRVRANIFKISDSRTSGNAIPIDQLQKHYAFLDESLIKIFSEDKSLRIERIRLTNLRNQLKSEIIDLRKRRLEKQAHISQIRIKVQSVFEDTSPEGPSEVERLENRKKDLEADVEALMESKIIQQRERDVVFWQLMQAQEDLQELLTEKILWQIQILSRDSPSGTSREGKAGVIAEFLGRLLILEKEWAQVEGLLKRERNLS